MVKEKLNQSMYKFLPDDFKHLEQEIEQLSTRIKEIGQDMGKSCQEGAETFHDNFAYEQGERDQRMWAQRRHELLKFKNHAQIVNPSLNPIVSIGKRIKIKNQETGEEQTWTIGSYLTFEDEHISYAAPIAKLLIGAKSGEMRTGNIAGVVQTFIVLEVN